MQRNGKWSHPAALLLVGEQQVPLTAVHVEAGVSGAGEGAFLGLGLLRKAEERLDLAALPLQLRVVVRMLA